MCITPTKKKTAANCDTVISILNISGCIISSSLPIKILGVFFTTDLDWRQHSRYVCSKFSQKIAIQ